MSWYNNPLMDEDFLLALSLQKEQKKYAKIIALSFDENPIEQIEGRVSQGGSVNVDGTSAVRRTCNLTLVAEDLDINNFYWGLNNKFKLEIGIENQIDEQYPEIIWFPQGTYVITAFNTNHSVSNYTISISGKDKMCLLNGDLGGNVPAQVDFGTEEYVDENGMIIYSKVPIKTIIRESLHTYAREPYHNIVLNDLDEVAVELLEYRGDEPLYLLCNINDETYTGYSNYTVYQNTKIKFANNSNGVAFNISDLEEQGGYYDRRIELAPEVSAPDPSEVIFESDPKRNVYIIAKVESGHTVGYRETDLVYAGDLILNVGEALTAMLDRIKSMLGNYEYFYDVDGRFIFQRKKSYVKQSWHSLNRVGEEEYADNAAHTSAIAYTFEGNNLISSFQNSPNLANLKNDYSIWGTRESAAGAEVPIHYRYAIDIKPSYYRSITTNKLYTAEEYDWRELIYQMALDFYHYAEDDSYGAKLAAANRIPPEGIEPQYQYGKTGYEQYYIDLQGFWRQLYSETGEWSANVLNNPAALNFWFDFLDVESELGQFAIPLVGDRTKVINDSDVSAIYFREVPNLIFTTYEDYQKSDLKHKHGYSVVFMNQGLENMFSISSQGKSAQDKLDELLFEHSYCIESINIQAIPVYHLQPNTRIFVKDDKTNVYGEYLVSKISVPLSYNGMMTITATKAPERLY